MSKLKESGKIKLISLEEAVTRAKIAYPYMITEIDGVERFILFGMSSGAYAAACETVVRYRRSPSGLYYELLMPRAKRRFALLAQNSLLLLVKEFL